MALDNNRPYDVVVFEPGAMFLDLIFEGLPQMPELGKEIFSKNLTLAPGGAYNATVAMARLGLKVAIVSQIGTDLISGYLESRLKKENVDCSHLVRIDGDARAITVSLTFPEDRAFVSYVDRDGQYDFPEDLLSPDKTKCLLLVQMAQDKRMVKLAQKARKASVKVAMDMHSPWGNIKNEEVRHILSQTDVILPNADESMLLSAKKTPHEALNALREFTNVVVKDGSNGAIGYENGEVVKVEPIETTVVDTTGAGDNFNAGFLSGWIDGISLKECLARGNVCAGLSVRHAGANEGSPTPEKMDEIIQTYGFRYKR